MSVIEIWTVENNILSISLFINTFDKHKYITLESKAGLVQVVDSVAFIYLKMVEQKFDSGEEYTHMKPIKGLFVDRVS